MSDKKIPKTKTKNVSIYNIAEDLNVSAGTVSRALRNRPEISAKTREKIRARATELGFKLRTFEGRITNICAVIETEKNQPSLFSTYVDDVLDGMWDYCTDNEIELSLYGADNERLNNSNLVRVLGRRGVSAAVFINTTKQSRYFKELNKQHFPYCCALNSSPDANAWTLRVDNEKLATRATGHLLQLGHRRIAFLDSLCGFGSGLERLKGYENAHQDAGIPVESSLIFSPPNISIADGFGYGVEAVRTLLSQSPRPTALIAMSDEIAIAAVHELKASGLRVPEDVSVLCFDDSPFCAYMNPAMTVVKIPNREVGYQAAGLAHKRLEGDATINPERSMLLNGELIVRESTGSAPLLQNS